MHASSNEVVSPAAAATCKQAVQMGRQLWCM